MKFEYDGDSEQRECVAMVIDKAGKNDLFIKHDSGWIVMYEGSEHTPNTLPNSDVYRFGEVVRRFYPGDKVTITF